MGKRYVKELANDVLREIPDLKENESDKKVIVATVILAKRGLITDFEAVRDIMNIYEKCRWRGNNES